MAQHVPLGMVTDRLAQLSRRVRPYLPFTALNTAWRSIPRDARSMLDVGCGQGEPMRFIRRKRWLFSVGVDIFLPYLRECRRVGIHDQYIQCDVRSLPFRRKSFDVVLCMEVLEHLDKEDGRNVINALEEIARWRVIITTPVGAHEQHEFDHNPYQQHQVIWQPAEMKALGYKVRGHGIKNLGGMSGRQSPLPRLLRPLVDVAWVLAGPLVCLWPHLAGNMVCIKTIKRLRL